MNTHEEWFLFSTGSLFQIKHYPHLFKDTIPKYGNLLENKSLFLCQHSHLLNVFLPIPLMFQV